MNYLLEKPVYGISGTEKYPCTIEWRNGQFTADEYEPSSDKVLGPDPYTLLLSSLASSALITLRKYIDEQGWAIDRIAIRANMYQENKAGRTITILDCDIVYVSPVRDEYKMQLLQIAKDCPVAKMLQGDMNVRVFTLREGDTKTIHYTNGPVTVLWKPEFCQHSTRCFTQLPQVFQPALRKWIDPNGAPAERIEQQVARCPSGALVFVKTESPDE